ncbi:condensation domain-containing protein, partial [Merismopedia glauca]
MLDTPTKESNLTIEGYDLSPQQKHLWQLQQSSSTIQPYRVQCAVEIKGNLDSILLKKTVEKVVAKHEILRTSFQLVPGLTFPLQVIGESKIRWIDRDINLNLEQTYDCFREFPFDLPSGEVLHCCLFSESSDRHILMLELSGLCADRLGLSNLIQEISYVYEGGDISTDTLQYADISAWQNDLLAAPEGQVGRDYWQQQNLQMQVKLPGEKPVFEPLEFEPQVFRRSLDGTLFQSLADLSSHNKTSIETVILAIWQIFWFKITGIYHLAIAAAFSGRKYAELQSSIGTLTKYLPLSLEFDNSCTLKQVIQKLDLARNEGERWQEYGDRQTLNLNLDFGFDYLERQVDIIESDITWSLIQQYSCLDRLKIRLSCQEKSDGLDTCFYYDRNLLDFEYIEQLCSQFETLIKNAIANPETAISELGIISDRERQQLLFDFNHTAAEYPQDKCFHQLFSEQVKRTPDNIAVVFEDAKLTYQQLESRANNLANYLQQLGVDRETLVGIYLERSLEVAIAILGILKAGGAYVPLDPAYPQERLNFILKDARIELLLTKKHLTTNLPNFPHKILYLDENNTPDI